MASDWLNHKQLMIVKGIQKTPGDSFSAEVGLTTFNLMSDGPVTLQEWSPAIPAVKNSGVWTDSPISDGRRLLAAPVGNVTEKMTILITDSTYLGVQKQLVVLNQMVLDCREFWQGNAQIEPIWLAWAAGCNNPLLPQYALLYNIETALTYIRSNQPTIEVNITLEREPYWRGIPPGANPKLWSYYVNSAHPQFDVSVSTLVTLSDHLITQTIQNKFEWTPAAVDSQVTPLSQNYIDITASQVPGDAPALVEMVLTPEIAGSYQDTFISLSSRDLVQVNHSGANKASAYNLAAGDGTAPGGAAKTIGTINTGLLSNNSAVNYTFVQKALVAGDVAYTNYLYWGDIANDIIGIDRHLLAGTYAVFLRAKATVDDTTVKVRITFKEVDGTTGVASGGVVFTDIPITGTGANNYELHYVGQLSIPFQTNDVFGVLGYGRYVRDNKSNLYITLDAKNSSGANRTLNILDLVFVPTENWLCEFVPTGTSQNNIIVDSTGYFSGAKAEVVAGNYYPVTPRTMIGGELRGQTPYLLPGRNQRLYFLFNSSLGPTPNAPFTVRLNIVPRWSGIRDV